MIMTFYLLQQVSVVVAVALLPGKTNRKVPGKSENKRLYKVVFQILCSSFEGPLFMSCFSCFHGPRQAAPGGIRL